MDKYTWLEVFLNVRGQGTNGVTSSVCMGWKEIEHMPTYKVVQ